MGDDGHDEGGRSKSDRRAGGLRDPGRHGSGQALGLQARHGAYLPLPDIGTLLLKGLASFAPSLGRTALRVPPESLAVIRWRDAYYPLEVQAEGRTGTETALLRDPVHRGFGGLQLALGSKDPLIEYPPQRGCPCDLAKAACEGPG